MCGWLFIECLWRGINLILMVVLETCIRNLLHLRLSHLLLLLLWCFLCLLELLLKQGIEGGMNISEGNYFIVFVVLNWFRNFSWLINFIHYSRTQSNLPEPAIEMAKESDCPSKDTTMAASKRLHGNQPACWSMINDLFSRRRVTIRFEGGDRCRRKVEILERLIAAINTSFLLYYFLTNFKRQIMSETGAGTSRVSTLYPSPWPSHSRAVNY